VTRRPLALTALTVAFEVVAVACFLLGARGLSGAFAAVPASTAALLLLLFGISAWVAFGLHGRRGWSRLAARVWSAAAVALYLWLFLGPPHGLPVSPNAALPLGLALLGFCALLEIHLPRLLSAAGERDARERLG
jgi:hypothetical protein